MTDTISEIDTQEKQAPISKREKIWKEKNNPLTFEGVKEMLADYNFQSRALDAIYSTGWEDSGSYRRNIEREFGFVGKRYEDGQKFFFSPVIQGQETSINLGEAEELLDDEDWEGSWQSIDDVLKNKVTSLYFHTHPTSIDDGVNSIMGSLGFQDRGYLHRGFSPYDLENFKTITTHRDPSAIIALGTQNPDGLKGTILLISFGNKEGFVNFGSKETYLKFKRYGQIGKDPFDAYREAGLNVAKLTVSLEEEIEIDQRAIELAARTLTTRIS